ncbi:MAG: hypothetical protein DWQ04_11835 [Chloroflexi bacterium]|nr:MAG: hypothetical protein DWQ04_11835 [Chloroflexota bacterium]
MNALSDRVAEHNVGSIFLYTHEAHPGENYPHHTSMKQKLKQARALHDVLGVTRPILADALDGACHRGYGSMPNMTWIFNRAGTPVYKSNWTDANSVANAIDYFLDVSRRRRERERLIPFRVERLDYRTSNQGEFDEGLRRSGPKAYREFYDSGL